MKILVSGGPVHAYLDSVKLLTNKFKGGRMSALATQLATGTSDYNQVTYLTSNLTKKEVHNSPICDSKRWPEPINIVYHDGYHDYRRLVRELAPQHDVVILGAAVANLVPVSPWIGKFPSHKYRIGEVFNIPMTVAPRVIDEVKRDQVDLFPKEFTTLSEAIKIIPASNPKCHLFGYKLLANVSVEELVEAAYDIVLASGATAVFANDANNLDQKYAVTKERAVIPLKENELLDFILKCANDVYYKTLFITPGPVMEVEGVDLGIWNEKVSVAKTLVDRFAGKFPVVQGGHVFGTVAVCVGDGVFGPMFVTTARGKKELQDWAFVAGVDHNEHEVHVLDFKTGKKATLNAPLLSHIFETMPDVKAVVHFHELNSLWGDVHPWAPPGTVRDSIRELKCENFMIDHHGAYMLLNRSHVDEYLV